MTRAGRGGAVVAFQPLIAVELSVSGGVASYLGPINTPRGTAIRGVKK
jgi:hypothetical protein